MRRTRRGHIKTDEVLQKLQTGRAGAIQVRIEAKINSDEYNAAGEVADAIDDLAGELTGDKTHFHEKGHG